MSGAEAGRSGPSRPRLVEGSVGRHLWELAAPMVVGLVAVSSYSIVDTFFVGQLGTLPLAALNFTFPVTFSLIAVALGIGVGCSSVLSRLHGAGDLESAQRITTHSLVLAVLLGFVVMAAGLASIDPIFNLLNTNKHTL